MIEAGIALVPEERRSQGLFTILTIRGNVPVMNMKKISRGGFINGAQEREVTLEYIDKLRIATSSIEKEAAQLSGGNQQKVVLSKCLFADADLLMLDEPTRGIDVGAKSEIYSIIRQLAADGKSILIFSSELPEVVNICDTIYLLYDGAMKETIRNGCDVDSENDHARGERCGDSRQRCADGGRMNVETTKPAQKSSALSRMSNETFITLFMIGVLVVLFLIFCLFVPNFFTPKNIINILTNNWYIVIIGIGVTFLLITGNFDMSVGGVIAMTGVLSVYFAQASNVSRNVLANGLGLPYGVAVALALLCAMGVGGVNAFFVAKLKVPSIIVTLGTMMLARGVGQVVTQGAQRNTSLPDVFGVIGNAAIPGTTHQDFGADHGRPDDRRLHLRAQDGAGTAHVPDRREPGGGPALRRQGDAPAHARSTSSARCWPASPASC